MREVHLGWDSETIGRSEFKFVVEICDYFEVIAHLEITPKGVRQLVRVKFQADKNPNDQTSTGKFIDARNAYENIMKYRKGLS